MDQRKKNANNYVTSIIILILLCYMGFTQRIQEVAKETIDSNAQEIAIYDIEEVYKVQGKDFADKCVVDPSYDGLKINTYYKNDSGEVIVDFSDIRLNKRYLMRIKSKDRKDKEADYNMNNGLILNSKDIFGKIKENNKLKRYTCFYIEEYTPKKTEGLIELSKTMIGDFEEYIDKDFIEETEEVEKTEKTEGAVEESSEAVKND